MDPGITRILHDALHRALHDPQHLALLERMDMPLAYLNSADYAASLPATLEEQRLIVRDLGLRM